jgi:hypothetical protein
VTSAFHPLQPLAFQNTLYPSELSGPLVYDHSQAAGRRELVKALKQQ